MMERSEKRLMLLATVLRDLVNGSIDVIFEHFHFKAVRRKFDTYELFAHELKSQNEKN